MIVLLHLSSSQHPVNVKLVVQGIETKKKSFYIDIESRSFCIECWFCLSFRNIARSSEIAFGLLDISA